jgi:DNA replication and repair protein RecF
MQWPVAAWVERLQLTNFRGYVSAELRFGSAPIVLLGPNGAGKTNLLEAISLLAPGQGLRRAPYPDLAREGGNGDWAVAARLVTPDGAVEIGTGLQPGGTATPASGRIVRIDGVAQSGSGALADFVDMVKVSKGHDICAGQDAWVNGVNTDLMRALAFHPFAEEQQAVADLIMKKLDVS